MVKWYNMFVSVEGSDPAPPEDGRSQPQPSGDAARMIAEIAASVQPPVESKMPTSIPVQASPTAPASFQEIYSAAEISTPAHGYTVYKIADMLQSDLIKNLPGEVKRSSILLALEAAGVKVQDVIQDAIRRDKALDTFERLQSKQLDDFESAKLDENRKIQAEIDRLVAEQKAKMQANNEAVTKRKESLANWRLQKQIEEQKIFDAVSYFVPDNPITTAGRPGSPASPNPASPNKS